MLLWGQRPRSQLPEERPCRGKGCPSRPLKPGEGRGCPVLLTWGARLSPPTSHRGRRVKEQWAVEHWLQRRPAGIQARGGVGVGACPPHSKRKVLQESWWWLGSPHGGPRCQGYGRERKTGVIAALCPGLKLSRVLPERVLQAPPQFQEPPQVHPDLRVGKGTNQHVSTIPPKPGWSGSPGADYLH